jgi:hypothetical protein
VSAPPATLPTCPHLPPLEPGVVLDWRTLNELGPERGGRFYLRCLTYAHDLWQRGLAARALLAADRALLADLHGDEPDLARHPLPYLGIAWMIAATPPGVFIGNPRVHYQHLADRVREPRRAQRSARAWACWHLARLVRPDLPGDPRHQVTEPTAGEIAQHLAAHGIAGETATWQAAVADAGALRRE